MIVTISEERLRAAIVAGLWDANDNGEEGSEIGHFIERDASVILKHVLWAAGTTASQA